MTGCMHRCVVQWLGGELHGHTATYPSCDGVWAPKSFGGVAYCSYDAEEFRPCDAATAAVTPAVRRNPLVPPVLARVTNQNTRFEVPGASVLPPSGADWFTGYVRREDASYLFFGRAVRQLGHTISVWLGSEPAPALLAEPDGIQAMLEAVSRERLQGAVRRFGGQSRPHAGARCFRYAAATDQRFRVYPGMTFESTVTGLTCRHPQAAQLIRLIAIQTVPQRIAPLAIDHDTLPLFDSLQFSSLETIARP